MSLKTCVRRLSKLAKHVSVYQEVFRCTFLGLDCLRKSIESIGAEIASVDGSVERFPPDLSREFRLAVFPAGPQPRAPQTPAPDRTGHCRTSTNRQPQTHNHKHRAAKPQTHNPRTHKQHPEPQSSRPWQRAPHHRMKTNDCENVMVGITRRYSK